MKKLFKKLTSDRITSYNVCYTKLLREAKTAKGAGAELTDEEALQIISKLAKQGSDAATIFKQQGRDDLYEQEMAQVAVYEQYLPAKMSNEELSAAVKAIVEEVGATSIKDMGKRSHLGCPRRYCCKTVVHRGRSERS